MEYLVVCLISPVASSLTLFSGFGIGKLLLPAFLLFFPAEVAVATAAIIHLFNNLSKLTLLGRLANRTEALCLSLSAIGAWFVGAGLLVASSGIPSLMSYSALGQERTVLAVNAAW